MKIIVVQINKLLTRCHNARYEMIDGIMHLAEANYRLTFVTSVPTLCTTVILNYELKCQGETWNPNFGRLYNDKTYFDSF